MFGYIFAEGISSEMGKLSAFAKYMGARIEFRKQNSDSGILRRAWRCSYNRRTTNGKLNWSK